MNRLSNEQQIQEFLDWLRNEKKYTIAHQFNMPMPSKGQQVYAGPQWILYTNKALSEIKQTDQQLLDEFFHGITPPVIPIDYGKGFGKDRNKKWWQDGGWCGCLVMLILIIIVVSYCSHAPH